MIRPQLPIPSRLSVTTTATAMPTAAIMLPRLAVVGWVPWRTPTMKSTKATMYAAWTRSESGSRAARGITPSPRLPARHPEPTPDASGGVGV